MRQEWKQMRGKKDREGEAGQKVAFSRDRVTKINDVALRIQNERERHSSRSAIDNKISDKM